ncbi:hypothetical protein B0H16DRAFT_1330197 [Mycena metata]|uniref:FAD-binding domain-containing protein n=1 Tax=Mycena metata TaxID=1033252 RepID=A0AAD7MSG6_9AGAR|nr:hypothetical protein B0H16DRAFT_1330197 [Mycena metata]
MSLQAVLPDNSAQPATTIDGGPAPGQLDIAIIGAGLVGLATAAMMRKEGHRITIFESSSFHAEIGAGIVLTPNGVKVLKKLLPKLIFENLQTVDLRTMDTFDTNGTPMGVMDLSAGWETHPEGWLMMHRVDVHKELMRLALEPDTDALPPAIIRLGKHIEAISFDAEHPSLTIAGGEEFKFDLILGADGIKSTVRRCVIGTEYEAPPSLMAFYRWMVDLKKNPEVAWIRDDRKITGTTNVMGKSVFLFMYPVRGGNLINISAPHMDKRDKEAIGDYCKFCAVPMDTFRAAFEDDCDRFLSFVKLTEKPRVWQVRAMPVIPTWIKGNVALLGDAAHAMFPTYGQGFGMGLEDAAALTTLFPSGTKASEIPARLKAFQEIRKPRAEHIAKLSADGMKSSKNMSAGVFCLRLITRSLLDEIVCQSNGCCPTCWTTISLQPLVPL